MSDPTLAGLSDPLIDDRMRGFPTGHPPIPLSSIGEQGWKPFDGTMALPLLSLDRAAFAGNVRAMMDYVRGQKVEIAPHAKTPMSPALAAELLAAGAWGTTVADLRQASVMLKAGFSRLILANEIGGRAAARRLASLLTTHPEAELHLFVDSTEAAAALAEAWAQNPALPPLGLLVELGSARGGVREAQAAVELVEAVLAREHERFRLSGIACYEGAAATADPVETVQRIDALLALTASMTASIRARIGPRRPLIVTAGGSIYFDLVVAALRPLVEEDGNATLVLRSGAIFFYDHGLYERGIAGLDARAGFRLEAKVAEASRVFKPALRLWAEVLARPEPDLAICGMGMRDVSMDQDLPRPLALYRDGVRQDSVTAEVFRLNDQHAFVRLSGNIDVRIGDVIEFGISHPCTCIDRHAILYGIEPDGRVSAAFLTNFG